VDATLLRRVAHNLVSNARRFVDKNGVVRVACALEAVPDGQDVVLTVANSGPGIPPERRPTLFDKYRVNPDGRVARGMGLYFCRLACEAHGGSITLSEDADFPTVFIARFACGARAGGRPPAA
jgi:two-component system, OmpR family, heavy metal sensor histidine kinase CusS